MIALEDYCGWDVIALELPADRRLFRLLVSDGQVTHYLAFYNDDDSPVDVAFVSLSVRLVDSDGNVSFGELEEVGWRAGRFFADGDFGQISVVAERSSPVSKSASVRG